MFALKDVVAKGKVVRFLCLMADSLWYESEDGFAFPVPLSETPGATFLAEDKALLYMRHIRKYLPTASGLEAGLAKSMVSAVNGPTVKFVHFKESEVLYETADGFQFPTRVEDGAVYCAVEAESRFSQAIAAQRLMLEQARQVA